MAKQKSIMPVSGKLDDLIFSTGKYGANVQRAPEAGLKKDQPALKKNYTRTEFLNNLAGGIKDVVKAHGGKLKPSNFYHVVSSRFRKEPVNNRFVLIKLLEGMEVHPKYPLSKLSEAKLTVIPKKKMITVRLEVNDHPDTSVGTYKVNCYSYEVSLMCWVDDADRPLSFKKESQWIFLKDDLLDFEFNFDRVEGTVEWLVCLKIKLGVDKKPISALIAEGMQIISAGSFNKKDIALWAKREKERKEEERVVPVKADDDAMRVQAIGRRKR
ncbi:MAG: hypothetical protein J7527_09145 [Chitinophagaceae bacterium]|nr:hypothetical protein [Chitinophagaceae bacterium]